MKNRYLKVNIFFRKSPPFRKKENFFRLVAISINMSFFADLQKACCSSGYAMPSSESSGSESSPIDVSKSEFLSEAYRHFIEANEALATPEEKIAHGLQFIRNAISQEGTPRFREFWEARRYLLQFFKQNLNSSIRSKLWDEYVELTVEARRLKEILEEQSAFAMEQIDLAIRAIEQDLSEFELKLSQAVNITFSQEPKSLEEKTGEYASLQKELNLLNALAGQLNSLRKEVIKTEMRIRYKTKFFKRLSEAGDRVFPRRKELIEEISSRFLADVELFVKKSFPEQMQGNVPYYVLRDEIKALQSAAKTLTLNTPVFTSTRMQLSECWDQIKELEKSYKEEFHQRRQESAENKVPFETKLEELQQQIEKMDLKELDAALRELQTQMRAVKLSKEDVRDLRGKIEALRAPLVEKEEEKRRETQRIEQEKLEEKRKKVAALKDRIAALLSESDLSVETLQERLNAITSEIEQLSLGKFELQQMQRLCRPVKDTIAEKKESSLLRLDSTDLQALQQFKEVLVQRKERRQEIKEQIESFRKALSKSDLDFEKALLYQEQLDQEKDRLKKVAESITEVEQKIGEIEEKA